MLRSRKILVVAAHPDDEVLGCGGSIARHVAEGSEVYVAILAEGLMSRAKNEQEARLMMPALDELKVAAETANKILGVSRLVMKQFPDNCMDTVPRLNVIKVVEELVESFQPDLVYTHHGGDVNIDHQVIYQAVVTACRPLPAAVAPTLLFFETVSSTEWQMPGAQSFQPNWFNDITEFAAVKRKALEAYAKEMRQWPHPRSLEGIEALARWRGASVGRSEAEAFMLGRHIWNRNGDAEIRLK